MVTAFHCTRCGAGLPADARFCAACGSRVAPPSDAGWESPPGGVTALEVGPAIAHAGFWLRVVASIIDGIIVGVATSAVGSLVAGAEDGGVGVSGSLTLFGNWLYYALLEAGPWQATVGKRVLGLIVTDGRGGPITFGRATGRYFGKIVSAIILGIGFLMAGFTARKQALHDIMAGTLVVKRPSGYART